MVILQHLFKTCLQSKLLIKIATLRLSYLHTLLLAFYCYNGRRTIVKLYIQLLFLLLINQNEYKDILIAIVFQNLKNKEAQTKQNGTIPITWNFWKNVWIASLQTHLRTFPNYWVNNIANLLLTTYALSRPHPAKLLVLV